MVDVGGRAGVTVLAPGAGWARPSSHAIGNDLPPITGTPDHQAKPGPAPPGQIADGQAGGTGSGIYGSDPASLQTDPTHVSVLGTGQESDLAYGLQGFNDKLTVWDRHAFWNAGTQRTGTSPSVPGNPPNPVTDGPAQPALGTVSRVISYQYGSDATRNQDDLSRAYTWLGEQGSGYSPVYGGVPGLYVPYATREGVPYPIYDPTDGEGGRDDVWSGPPHGLHSETLPDGAESLQRYMGTPQMKRPRIDRPSNSPQAGQSYSQTVQYQGGAPVASGATAAGGVPGTGGVTGRGWLGGS